MSPNTKHSSSPEKRFAFKKTWETKYAVEATTRDPRTGAVISAVCKMCQVFGRERTEEDDSRKRKRTERVKYYSYPFRVDNIRRHLELQHPQKWEDYSTCSKAERQEFFSRKQPASVVSLRSFVHPAEANLSCRHLAIQKTDFVIEASIVDVLIGDLLFDSDDENAEDSESDPSKIRARALKIFVPLKDDDEDDNEDVRPGVEEDTTFECYSASVASVLKLNLIVKFISIGVSFRQASRLYMAMKEEIGLGLLGSVTDTEVAQLCRIVCASNLQQLKDICNSVWAFSIALDGGNNAGSSYLDIRIRFFVNGDLHNFHLFAIPMRERHTGEYQFNLAAKFLSHIAPTWQKKLIGIASDGASTMTGCVRGVVSRLCRDCDSDVFRIWCGAHQLDLVMKRVFHNLLDDEFVAMLTAVTGHLRRQQNLITEMKSACPTFVETRWISMGKTLKWLKDNRIRLVEHFDRKRPRCRPPVHWWIVVIVIQRIVERVEKTFVELQGLNTLVCEQSQLLSKLASDIAARTNVVGPLSDEDIEAMLQRGEEELQEATGNNSRSHHMPHVDVTIACIDSSTNEGAGPSMTAAQEIQQEAGHHSEEFGIASRRKIFRHGQYIIDSHSVLSAMEESGTFVINQLDIMRASRESINTFDMLVRTIANFSLDLIEGISKIVAERGMDNNAAEDIPPVLPLELCAMSHRDFGVLLEKQGARLSQTLTSQEIEMIDEQFRNLKLAYREEAGIKNSLDAFRGVQSMKECWSPLGESYDLLRTFCGGIATVMPGTSSVEADFSAINWIKDKNSQRMTDFSLESILHCKQRTRLTDVWNKLLRNT